MLEVGELSVRRQPNGGPVADRVQILGQVSPAGKRQIVLLMHGYANDQQTASGSYDNCINNLKVCTGAANSSLPSPFFKFYWPGDTRLRWFSELSYPWEITPAIESGTRLAEFLANLAGPDGTPLEVHLVAHSLGNRVMLEMLEHLRHNLPSSLILRSASLMAAAVPVRMLQDPMELMLAALAPHRRHALFSTADRVLHWAFPLGETAANEGFFPEAVGRRGNPPYGVWTTRISMNGYGHSDYWRLYTTASVLAGLLGATVASPSTVNVISARQATADRSLPSAPPPAVRSQQVRPSPGS